MDQDGEAVTGWPVTPSHLSVNVINKVQLVQDLPIYLRPITYVFGGAFLIIILLAVITWKVRSRQVIRYDDSISSSSNSILEYRPGNEMVG